MSTAEPAAPSALRVVCVAGRPGPGIPAAEAAALVDQLADEPTVSVEVVGDRWAPEPNAVIDCLVAGIARHWLGRLPPGVAWVQVWAVGVERMPSEIHTDGRVVSCQRGGNATPIAEFVRASMLAVEKQPPQSWITWPPDRCFQADLGGLADRRLAVLGLGSIGAAVAHLALAFSMSVVGLRSGGRPVALEGVETATDALALVARMGPGAHLVNVARGRLVDQEALRQALDDGRVGWASLDVVDPEPLPEGHWLYDHPRVHLTPHISWSGPGHRFRHTCVDNIRRRADGQPLHGVVDPAVGY